MEAYDIEEFIPNTGISFNEYPEEILFTPDANYFEFTEDLQINQSIQEREAPQTQEFEIPKPKGKKKHKVPKEKQKKKKKKQKMIKPPMLLSKF